MAEKKNDVIKKARKEIEYLTGDDEVARMAELREKWDLEYEMSMNYAKKQGLEDGMEQGIKEGKEQGIKEGKEQGIREGKEQGIREGKEQGIKAGEENEKMKIAVKLLELGEDVEKIAQITELEIAKIEELRKK